MQCFAGRVVVLTLTGLVVLLAVGICPADNPYTKRSTWVDTMIATRHAMARMRGAKPPQPKPLPDFGKGRYTVMAWIKTDRGGTIFSKSPAQGQWIANGKSLFVTGGRVTLDIGWVGEVRARARVGDGRWHHVALVSRAERRQIFVDGRLGGSGVLEAAGDGKGWMVKVGHTAGDFGGRFDGLIDEFRVYARAMSPEQVKAAMTKPDDSALVLHWPFEGDCSDVSGSLNSATKMGNCRFAPGKIGKALKLGGNGYAMFAPGTPDPSGPLWARLSKDFADDVSRQEMDWEREDDVWGTNFSAIDLSAIAARYAKATRTPTALAGQAAKLAATAKTASDVKAVRELYLKSRRRGELLKRISRFKLKELRATIASTCKDADAKRSKLLARLDAAEATALAWTAGPSSGKAFEDWKAAVAALRHDALLNENPLFGTDKLLFIKRQTYHSSHFYTDFIDGVGRYGGNLCVLDLKSGKVTDLIPEMKSGIFGRFDLHFSARKVVFDWKKAPREGFRLFEVDIDPKTGLRTGTKVRQLTFPPDDEQARIKKYDNSFLGGTARMYYHQTDDMHPCYLPDGGIVFTSTRCEYGTLCDAPDVLSTAIIHRIDGDGKNLQMLTNSPVSEFSPSMMADGRILYTRWEYVDKGQLGIKCLWAMRPDGSGTVEVYGNDIQYPPTLLHGRQIPGYNDMYVVLGTPHYPQSGIGTVIRLDMTRNIRTREPMTYITPHVDIRQEPGWNHLVNGRWVRHTNGPLYMDPYPLSKDLYLVAHNPDKKWSDPTAYGLYIIDAAGSHELIHKEPETSCWQPYPLRKRKTPPILPSTRNPELAKKNLAVCTVQDVYHGMEGVKRGDVKYLRIMEQVPRPWACRRFWDLRSRYGRHTQLVSRGSVLAVKVLRGVVPVYSDGSAHFYVPADKNIYFEAIDENYMEIQRERTYVNYRPGEIRSCVGCHETPTDSLPKRSTMTIAHRKPPSVAIPQPGDKAACRPIHYITDVQPVLDRHCVRCHGATNPAAKLDLTGEMTKWFNRSYENIMRRRLVKTTDEGSDWGGTEYLPPKSVGSYASKFILQVKKGCPGNDKKLPLADFVKLTTWVDANAQYHGSYWGRRHPRFKDHPNFRPVPTFAEAISTKAPVMDDPR